MSGFSRLFFSKGTILCVCLFFEVWFCFWDFSFTCRCFVDWDYFNFYAFLVLLMLLRYLGFGDYVWVVGVLVINWYLLIKGCDN